MISAFGERAKRWAAATTVDDDVIAVDETAFLDAIVEAVRRRMRGETFAAAVFVDEDPNRFAKAWGAKILRGGKSFDERRNACAAIAAGAVAIDGKRQAEMSGLLTDVVQLGRLFWHLADRGAVVSETAYARLAGLFLKWHAARVVPVQDDPDVPRPTAAREGADHVVIWGGNRSADTFAITLCALEELHMPVYVVCRGGSIPQSIHRCTVAQAEPLLRSAAAIVDVTDDAPGTALALARFGAPIAAPRSSGVHEFLTGVSLYDAWIRDSILAATLSALGRAAPVARPSADVSSSSPARTRAVIEDAAPLVSIVTLTRDRRTYLERALASVARQQYPRIETVVLADGEPVRDVAERFGAVLIEGDGAFNHARAWNAAIARARGEFIAFLDDDDLLFPDHVSSLVDAAKRAGASAVHAGSVIGHRGEGPEEFVGFSPGGLMGIDIEEALVNCPTIGMIASMVRRDLFEKIGYFDESIAPNDDYEMIVRIAMHVDWVRVDRVTYLYSREGGYDHISSTLGRGYADLYESAYRRQPFPDRPLLAVRRRQFVERLRAEGVRLNTVSLRLARPVRLTVPAKVSTGTRSERGSRTLRPKGK